MALTSELPKLEARMAARKKAIEKQPYEATTYAIVADEALGAGRLDQLVQEVAALFQGGVRTWEMKLGKRVVKVKVWESGN
jgi:hypothetical protein